MRWFLVLATSLAAGGCLEAWDLEMDASSLQPARDGGCDATLDLGTGATVFVPVTDGDEIELHQGPQGGFMFYLALRVTGLAPEDTTVCYVETFATGERAGEVLGEDCWRVELRTQLDDGSYERLGVWGELGDAWWASPDVVLGSDVRVDVKMTDAGGCEATDGWTVHVADELGK